MPIITSMTRRDVLVLIAILLIAGGMRFGRGDIVEYFHDDAMLATLALEVADGEGIPVTGILSSTGIPNPPTSVYVMAIPFMISTNPHVAIYFVMSLNVLGVGILWFFAHRYFGRQVGWVAGLLYAINPWAVLFSRKIWAQDFHTPFILLGIFLLMYGLWEASQRSEGKIKNTRWLAQVTSVPILLFAFQIHFASWALFPIILIALWVGRHRFRFSAIGIILVLCLLILGPYLIGLSQTLQQDPTRISDAAGRSSASDGIGLTTKPIIDTIYLSSGTGLETWVAPDQIDELKQTYLPIVPLSLMLTLVMSIGIWGIWRGYRQLTLFILLWAFLPQLALLLDWTPVYIHYFIPSIPAMMLLASLGFSYVLRHAMSYRYVYLTTWGFLVIIVGLQVLTWHQTLDYLDKQHVPYPGFTTPIGDLNNIRSALFDSEDVLIISQGMSWNLHHEVSVWDTLFWDDVTCVRTMLGDGYAVFPAQSFRVVISPDAPQNPVNNLYQTESPRNYETRNGDNGYIIHDWQSSPEWTETDIQTIEPTQFDNGVALTGYAIDNDKIYLEWRLPVQSKGADYQYSAQLFDDDGNRVAQVDKTFWHGRHWCLNDRLITWGTLSGGSSASVLKVGMYILGTGSQAGQFFNANVLDPADNPIGQSVDIQLE